jgi:hypothetical protein
MKGPIHTKFVLLVGLDERGAFDLLSGLTGSRPWQLRCVLALIVKVALDLDALRRQMKVGFDARFPRQPRQFRKSIRRGQLRKRPDFATYLASPANPGRGSATAAIPKLNIRVANPRRVAVIIKLAF